ncbi:hypothetical protein ZWY2020_022310 [Hordeum vulgare]|nr:hypothetical protein ZWY2020_022310 [Hordeum vulgare]
MDGRLGWQKVVEDLAGNHQHLRAQYGEIARWFPSVQMMRNHARGLVKVMTSAEKQRAFPSSFNIPPPTVLLWAMRESQLSPDPRQRARWWMYRSSTTPPAIEDPARVAYKEEHVTDVVPAVPAHINTSYWENRDPWVLRPDSDSDDEVEELVVLSDEVEEDPIVQVLAPVIDTVEGDKNRPIDWRSYRRSQISQRSSSSSKRWRKMSPRRGRRRGLRRRRLRCGAPTA